MNPTDEQLRQARAQWRWTGDARPPFAQTTRAGEESVWDYPRPPRIAADARLVMVRLGGVEIARSHQALCLLETASPPTFYLPESDIRMDLLTRAGGTSFCEWKGEARYWRVQTGLHTVDGRAWSYPAPFGPYAALAGHIGFYPTPFNCEIGGMPVEPQPGGFYAGWVTPDVVGPFKGDAGSGGW